MWLVNTSVAIVESSVKAFDAAVALDFPSLRLLEGSALLVADCVLRARDLSLRIALPDPPTGEALNPDSATYAHGHSDLNILGSNLAPRGIDRSVPSSVTIRRSSFDAPSALTVALTNASFDADASNTYWGASTVINIHNASEGLDWALVAPPPPLSVPLPLAAHRVGHCPFYTFFNATAPADDEGLSQTLTHSASFSHGPESETLPFSQSLHVSRSPQSVIVSESHASGRRGEECASKTSSLPESAVPITSPSHPLTARSTLDAARLRSHTGGGFAFFGDPFSLEVKLAAAILAGPCASGADRSMGRASRYLLSPFIDLGAAAVGIAHCAIFIVVLCAHAAIAAHRRAPLLRPSRWPSVLFPAVPSATLLVLFPGAADALFSIARGGTNEAFGVVGALCAAVVVVATVGLTAAATARIVSSSSPSDASSDAGKKDLEAKSDTGSVARICTDAVSPNDSNRPSLFSSSMSPKPSHRMSLYAERAWALPMLFVAVPSTPSPPAVPLLFPAALLCIYFAVIGVMCAAEALAPGADTTHGDGSSAPVSSLTNCGARGVASGAVLLALAAAVAALRPFSRAAIDALTAVATANMK